MARRLAGKSAIITGGGDGIGQGLVRRFAAEGARILVAEINPETGAQTAAAAARDFNAEVVFRQVDVTKQEEVEAMVADASARWGGCDILINNAWGGGNIKRIENKTAADMTHGITMGFYAAMWAMLACFPYMKGAGWGRIVNMCSLNGVNAHVGSADYNSGREALRAYTRSAAREWAPLGITCNVICPGAASAAYRRFKAENPETAAAMAKMNPMGRVGDPEADIAPVALFLSSDDSRYITGNTIFAGGGSHINGVPWAPDLPD